MLSESIVATYGDVILIVEFVDSTQFLLLTVLNVLKVHVTLQLCVDFLSTQQQLLSIVKCLDRLGLNPCQTFGRTL
jgi:hypothetical protein